jgi:acylphosphatase
MVLIIFEKLMPTVQIIIKGKVQGVYYRATAKKQALDLGITGEIRNTKAGNVEVIITGNENQVEDFISWCHKGPSGAIVTHVEVNNLPNRIFTDFSIVH